MSGSLLHSGKLNVQHDEFLLSIRRAYLVASQQHCTYRQKSRCICAPHNRWHRIQWHGNSCNGRRTDSQVTHASNNSGWKWINVCGYTSPEKFDRRYIWTEIHRNLWAITLPNHQQLNTKLTMMLSYYSPTKHSLRTTRYGVDTETWMVAC